jgi:hypothetical protein
VGWEDEIFTLFDDLEQQAQAAYDAEREVDLVDRSRTEYAAVTLAARLMASVDQEITLDVAGVGPLAGALARVADGWCLVESHGRDWVVRLAAVSSVTGASERAVPDAAWSPVARLGLGSALRRVADAGERCVVHRTDGERYDGVLLRVGQDFAELQEPGRPDATLLVAFERIAAVQSGG